MSQGQRGNIQPALSTPYQSSNPRQPETSKAFFSQTNYARILQPLREQYERKTNTDELPDDVDKRLQKSLQHYMNEIFRVNGANTPINTLNQEVYRETTLNFDSWLQKQVSTSNNISTKKNVFNQPHDNLFDSIGNRFEREQQTRAPAPSQPIGSVDFTLPKNDDEDNEDPLEKFERLRKQRESEAKTSKAQRTNDQYSEPSAPPVATSIPPVQQSNPAPPPLLAPRPQEYIIKQEDVVKYKENEINLFINSGDRDWLANRNENRYNFTINFNTVNTTGNKTFSPSIKERFRNIVRMELVKTILSSESLDVTVRQVSNGQSVAPDSSRIVNLLSYPYVMIRISEWSSNGYGTNDAIDNTFGIVQYDQTWKSDSAAANFGYISMTPRYLKAQRVYQPTPLATLQKLTIQVERPDGNPLTTMLDTLDIKNIYLSDSITTSNYATAAVGPNSTNNYIIIRTQKYFSRFFVSEGDRIQIRGYASQVQTSAQAEFDNYINSSEGNIVVGIGYSNALDINDGFNSAGYSNCIIIRSRFVDPTTGLVDRNYFGGSTGVEQTIQANLLSQPSISGAALLNSNRQSHFVLRLITREMDAASNLRPDNS
jgi:hypothetical protein